MSSSQFKLLTKSEILEAFPAPEQPITGEMNLRELIRIIVHMMKCAQAVQYEGQPLAFLYLACPENIWPNYSQDPYPQTPGHPGNFPQFAQNATAAEIANQRALWEWQNKQHRDPDTMNQALVHRFLSLLPLVDKMEYEERRLSHPNEPYLDCVGWFVAKYGDTTEPEREDNRQRMRATWQLADGFNKLQKQIEEGMLYALVTNAPIPQADVIDIAITVMMQTGLFEPAYEQWHARPAGTKTWQDFKTFWAEKVRLKKLTSQPAGGWGFGMNATEQQQQGMYNTQEDDRAFAESVNDFSRAHDNTQATIANLAYTNQQMQAANAQLCQQVAMLAANQYQANNNNWNGNNNNNNNSSNKKKKNGKKGKKNKSGWTGYEGTGGGNNNNRIDYRANRPDNVRTYNGITWCWTHGNDCGHNSNECEKRHPNHNANATYYNQMGGNPARMERTIDPSTVGLPGAPKPLPPSQRGQQQQQFGGFAQQMPVPPVGAGPMPAFQQVPTQQYAGFGMQQPAGQGTMQVPATMPTMPPMQGAWPGTMHMGMNMGQGRFM